MISYPLRIFFDLFSLKSIKAHALVDFLVNHPSLDIEAEWDVKLNICEVDTQPWILKFDGSNTENSDSSGIVIFSSNGIKMTLSFNLAF